MFSRISRICIDAGYRLHAFQPPYCTEIDLPVRDASKISVRGQVGQ